MDDLLEKFRTGPCKAVGLVDDVVLLIRGPVESTLVEVMQDQLKKVDRWCVEKGLSLNAKKTVPVMFSLKRKTNYGKLVMRGGQLEYEDCVTNLGLTLHKKLSWSALVDAVVKKAKGSLMALRGM